MGYGYISLFVTSKYDKSFSTVVVSLVKLVDYINVDVVSFHFL